jgi:hypothetical protein
MCDDYGKTWFLIWQNKWTWRAADFYVPPNYEVKYKWIVAGTRTFQNYPLLCKELDKIREQIGEVVCGEARGADMLGNTYAYDNDIKVKGFPADWEHDGKAAGFIRNEKMAAYADKAIVFWDGKSVGSKDIIDRMEKLGKEVRVIYYDRPGTD